MIHLFILHFLAKKSIEQLFHKYVMYVNLKSSFEYETHSYVIIAYKLRQYSIKSLISANKIRTDSSLFR